MKKNRLNLQLSYQPERLKPYLEDVFGERQTKARSLDKAIEIVENDLKRSDIIAYDDFKKERNTKILWASLGTLALVLGSGIWGIYRFISSDRQRDKELKELV